MAEQTEISAGFVHTQNDGDVVTVGFADQQHDTNSYVLLQRTLRPSDDDVRRGWDHIHVTVNDEGRSAYGGVQRIKLLDQCVLIDVSPETATHLRTGQTIRVNMANPPVDADGLVKALKLVCGGNVQFTQGRGA